jgi:hypothetical protein
LLAATASLGTHPAVLHAVLAVLFVLLTAEAASFGAGLKSSPDQLRVRGSLPRDCPARGIAHVGAVEVKADAAGERLGVILAETGVGAGGAALGTVEASFYALHQCGGVPPLGAQMGLERLLGVSHDTAFLWCTF